MLALPGREDRGELDVLYRTPRITIHSRQLHDSDEAAVREYTPAADFWMPFWLGVYDAGVYENGIHGLP